MKSHYVTYIFVVTDRSTTKWTAKWIPTGTAETDNRKNIICVRMRKTIATGNELQLHTFHRVARWNSLFTISSCDYRYVSFDKDYYVN